jgi:protein-disulfide isomerase
MAEDSVTIRKTTLQLVVVLVVALVVGFGIGWFAKPTANAVGQQQAALNPSLVPAPNPTPNPTPTANPTPAKVSVPTNGPTLGNSNAKVTVVEFSDFQCPFCERFYSQTMPQIKTDYIDTGKVKLVFKTFPLTGLHPNAQKAAEASLCANEQGKFWEYHNTLFDKQSIWSSTDGVTAFKQYASDLKLDTAKFNSCLDTGKYASAVAADVKDGQNAGISGTPSFVINGQLVVGAQPFSAFQSVIDQQLAA